VSAPGSRVFVTAPASFLGAAMVRALRRAGHGEPIGLSDPGLDLTSQAEVDRLFARERPEAVILCAGKTAGIAGNVRRPASLMLDNLLTGTAVMNAARRHGTGKLLYLASSCSYPRECPQPMREGSLLTGPLEPTNEAYAVAKIAGVKLAQAMRREFGVDFITAIPANSFGPGDDFSPEDSHVVGALMLRFREAVEKGLPAVTVWGTGGAVRDFLFVDDLADACVHLLDRHSGEEPVNVGSGTGVSIGELAGHIRAASGYRGRLVFDPARPDGMPVKVLDTGRLRATGWAPRTPLADALAATWEWFLASQPSR
jgi:GDP-L-fucose synthase